MMKSSTTARRNDSRSHPCPARTSALRVAALWLSVGAATPLAAQQASCTRAGTTPPPTATVELPADRQLAAFDSAVTIVGRTYPDSTFRGLPWQRTADSLRGVVLATPNLATTRRAIRTLLALLGESHFGVFPAPTSSTASDQEGRSLGLDVRVVEGVVAITHVTADGPAARAGVRTGARVLAVNGCSIDSTLVRADARSRMDSVFAARAALTPRDTAPVRLRLDTGTSRSAVVDVVITPTEPQQRLARMGNLGLMPFAVRTRREDTPTHSAGVISFSTWVTPAMAPLDSAIDQLRATDGLILDLRGNPGGVAGMVMGIGGHFIDSVVSLGTMTQRRSTLRFVTNPRRVSTSGQRVLPYAGPLAILVDGLSLSTSEFFAGGMQAVGRARIFGERTGGMALPAMAERLPNGDVLYHVIADFVDAGNRRLEGAGVTPDTQVTVTRAALLMGRDPVYDAALAWLRSQPRASSTGSTRH
jgi:carboxyl-terminal processing protease